MLSFLSLFHLHFMVICPKFLINTVCKFGGRTRYYKYVRLCLLFLITKICNSKKHLLLYFGNYPEYRPNEFYFMAFSAFAFRSTVQLRFLYYISHEEYNFLWTDDFSCLLYTSPSPRDLSTSRMPSSA